MGPFAARYGQIAAISALGWLAWVGPSVASEQAASATKRPTPATVRAPPAPGMSPAARNRVPAHRGYTAKSRVQIAVAPGIASWRRPFLGRSAQAPIAGASIGAELHVRVARWLWLHSVAGLSSHPVDANVSEPMEGEEETRFAEAGVLHTGQIGFGLAGAMDLGRFLPRIDAGFSVIQPWLFAAPPAAQGGQLGEPCREGNVCDLGLVCGGGGTCLRQPIPAVHVGLTTDVLFGARWALGVGLRYFGLLDAPAAVGAYWTFGGRAGLRF